MKNLKISIGSDHKGFEHKQVIIKYLEEKGCQVFDFGPSSTESVDYPDFAKGVCQAVQNETANFGILICYTGIGMSIVANKYKGIRGALVCSVENAALTRNHNNSNVLFMGAKDTNIELALQIVEVFLKENFEGGRHQGRVDKICEVEVNEKR